MDEDFELTKEQEQTIAQDWINAQKGLITFGAEREVRAVQNIISRSPCPKKDKKQKRERAKIWHVY